MSNYKMTAEEQCRLNKISLDKEIIVFSKELQRFIFTLTGDNYVKEDIFQNTVIRAYKSLSGVDGVWDNCGTIRSWLVQIAKTETYRHFSDEKKWRLKTGKEEFKEDGKGMGSEDLGYDILETLERNEALFEMVLNLKPNLAQVILAHYVYEMPLYEIAELTAQNYGTIRTRHRRALEVLREQYGKLKIYRGENYV